MVYRLTTLAREAGFKGLFAGLGPRMIMTAGLVASQFLMYGEIKRGTHHRFAEVPGITLFYSAARPAGARDSQGVLMMVRHHHFGQMYTRLHDVFKSMVLRDIRRVAVHPAGTNAN